MQGRQLRKLFWRDPEETAETILEEIILFPAIKRGIEFRRQTFPDCLRLALRQAMELHDLPERRFVKGAAHDPAFAALTPEIGLAQVFDPDQAFRRIVKINFRRPNFVRGE